MEVILELCAPHGRVRRVFISEDAIIGRSSSCNLRIGSDKVSRRHCKLSVDENGAVLCDLGSMNGTFLDGQRLEPDVPTPLFDGARIGIGPAQFTVRFEEARVPTAVNGIPGVHDGGQEESVEDPETVCNVGQQDETLNGESPRRSSSEAQDACEAEPPTELNEVPGELRATTVDAAEDINPLQRGVDEAPLEVFPSEELHESGMPGADEEVEFPAADDAANAACDAKDADSELIADETVDGEADNGDDEDPLNDFLNQFQ